MNWIEKIAIGIGVALLIFYIYLFVVYGGKPISECPTWFISSYMEIKYFSDASVPRPARCSQNFHNLIT